MSTEIRDEYEMSIIGPSCSSQGFDNRLPINPGPLIIQAARFESAIQSLNVIESRNVTVGPTFISVSQNVGNIDVTPGQVLGTETESPRNAKRLRCSIAVFVCWALVVAVVLIFLIIYFALNKEPSRLDLDIQEPWYIRRAQWKAQLDTGITILDLPVAKVIIAHSALDACTEKLDCIKEVLSIQKLHQINLGWEDIGPNFLVGGTGLIFEGRGANVVGAVVKSFNSQIISVMFLGDYTNDMPNMAQFNHLNILLKELVRKQVLTKDFHLCGVCQVVEDVVNPGPNVIDNLHRLDHWNPGNKSACLRS